MAIESTGDAARQGRRERELAIIYATSRALAALREVDEVLDTIVLHAHELMGSDLTYLSVLENGRLKLRASAGTVSAEFRNAEVPSTTGIGGRIIARKAPCWVRNYLAETDIEHSPEFDARVVGEDLIALLGVPLLTADSVLGILYVAERTERSYAPWEIAHLSALADHASVALENARLYEESQNALIELKAAYRTIERSSQVHEALGRIVLTGGGEADIAALLHETLGGHIAIVDRGSAVIAEYPDQPSVPQPEGTSSWQDALQRSRHSGQSVTRPSASGWHTVSAINTGDAYLGAILWNHRSEPEAVDVRTVERASHIVGLLMLKQDAVVEAEERLRDEVLTELLRARLPLSPELVGRGRAMRLDFSSFNSLIVVEARGLETYDVQRHMMSYARDWQGLLGTYVGHVVLAVESDDLQASVTNLHRRLRSILRAPLLVCGTALDTTATDFARAFTLASRCARVLTHAGVTDAGTTTAENAMYAALFDPERAEELTLFLDGTLASLLRHDERNNTALVATLTAYFANQHNVARTAREMHVHSNTLLKRLERVATVVGSDWKSPTKSLPLQLALRLHALRVSADG